MSATARKGVHPLTLAVVRYKFLAVAEEVVETMIRTCFSPLLNQSRDFSAVVLDSDCRVIAQAERVPIHMGAMPFAMRAMQEAFAGDIAEGDILMANDPYWGGSHLPDITIATPVFFEGRIRLWVANRSHQGDIGGLSAGGYSPEAREIFHEGIRIPPTKLAERGRMREDVLRLVCQNTRKPDDMRGDIMAQVASVRVGAERLMALFERYGAEEVERCAEAILDGGEAAMRAQLSRWKSGRYTGVSYLDDDGCGHARVPITVHVELAGEEVTVDFRDCPDQVRSFMNSPFANTAACVNVAFMYLSDGQRALNDGSARCIRILTRKGSIVDSTPPAPVTGCTTLTGSVIIEAVLRAMEGAAPRAALAGFARRFRFVIAGTDRDGKPYIWHLFSNRGGAGGNAAEDGWSNLGVIHNPGGSPSPSIERTEAGFPLFVESHALRPDSGGAGRQRGGLGGTYVLRYEGAAEGVLNAAGEGVVVAPYGIGGGAPGIVHEYNIARGDRTIPIGTKDSGVRLLPGDRITCRSAGGGGCGDPRDRAPDLLRRDLDYGYVTPEAARRFYGHE
ncbi:hydantoinase B/oxoprolinase family protein [Roseomonas sp. AR75]|uniref:hydantoinase B/oxoprolinase family protein n=1 Tax=Roseomonas sp. AR75 TaxID=2562311 RepID=UPI0010C09A88|nr:hydantoinase B/oxoprolinase family protein [Roseomonas sp. AR75]